MAKKGYTTYTLRVKYQIGNSTVQRLRKDRYVSTHTLDMLCRILDCGLQDIAEYIPDNDG
jgi:DNA-binding Xre family transcriptional regulator